MRLTGASWFATDAAGEIKIDKLVLLPLPEPAGGEPRGGRAVLGHDDPAAAMVLDRPRHLLTTDRAAGGGDLLPARPRATWSRGGCAPARTALVSET